jgi:hypothetical protein
MKIAIFKIIGVGVFCSLNFLLAGCGSSTTAAGAADSPSTGTTTTATDYPLYFHLTGKWEGSETVSFTDTTCNVPKATVAGGAVLSCTLKVPELTLHYSDITFTIGTNSATTCSHVSFHPYYYQRSVDIAYTPTGATGASDCSGATTPIPTVCFSGAAKSMVTDFPTYTGQYFVPGAALETTFDLASSNTLGATLDDDLAVFTSNANVSNGLALVDRAVDLSFGNVDYIGSTMQDYTATCSDPYGNNLYQIILYLVDSDSTSTPGVSPDDGVDSYWDWNAN